MQDNLTSVFDLRGVDREPFGCFGGAEEVVAAERSAGGEDGPVAAAVGRRYGATPAARRPH